MSRLLACAVPLFLLLSACSSSASSRTVIISLASPSVPELLQGLFQDHVVLKRSRPIPVWSNAPLGTAMALSLAGEATFAIAYGAVLWSPQSFLISLATNAR